MPQTGHSVGAYELMEPLGQGGMGVVWRAKDRRDGRQVALKTVRLPQASFLASIRREIHALAQIEHSGIVRILDEGVHEGMPWYAMELLEGQPLRSAVEHGMARLADPSARGGAAGPSAKIRRALTLVRRLCTPLGFLHGEGIVHRDLKPGNVLVRADGKPVLVDFGLAARFAGQVSREELDAEEGASGTLGYMSPEQINGELVDARADLYSLGCMLYELLTGSRPFEAAQPMELMAAHLFRMPQPPSKLVEGLPKGVDELLLQLLQKDPRKRLGHADSVAAALARLGARDDAEPAGPAPRAYLYRPGFSGRQEVLEQLRGHVKALRSKAGTMVLIGGESGVGKTRLLVELGRMAGQERARVLTGECLPPSTRSGGALGAAPLQAFRKALQSVADRCRELGATETERLLGNRAAVLAVCEPALAGLPGIEAQGQPAELPPAESAQRLCHYLAETLAALAERGKPLVLLLDDLQWADELSLGAMELLARSRADGRLPFLIVGVYRTEECGPTLDKLIAEAGAASSLRLERLGGSAVAQIVADMLGLGTPPQTFARFLLRQSEGNPFFVAEYLRAAVDRDLLYRDSAGRWQVAGPADEVATEQTYAALPLPRSLMELVLGRLSRLGVDAQRFIEALAVLGREADGDVLAEVSGWAGRGRWRRPGKRWRGRCWSPPRARGCASCMTS